MVGAGLVKASDWVDQTIVPIADREGPFALSNPGLLKSHVVGKS
jgi:hypothetical protein